MTTKTINVELKSGNTNSQIKTLDKNMRGLGAEADKTSKSIDKTSKSLFALSKVASGVFTGLLVNQIVTYTDKFTSLQNQLRQVTITNNQLAESTRQLLEVSNRSRTGISATTELYTQLTLSTKSLNLSTKEQLRLTETISKAFSVSGKTAAESEGAIRQLGQAFSAGALRGDEFNSIAEGAPEILRALERSLNLTTGELRAFAATGGITAEVLAKALSQASSVLDDKTTKSVKTFAQSTQEASNNLTVFIGESKELQTVVSAAGSAVVFASENIENFTRLISFGAAVLAARMLPTLTALAAGARSAAVGMGVMTVASRGLSAALSLLGGPLGVVSIAVSALVIFGKGAEDTKEKTARLAREVDNLADSYSNLNQQQRVVENNEIANEMQIIRDKIDKAYKSMIRIQDFNPFGAERFKTEIRDLNKELDVLSKKQQGLFKSGIENIPFTDLSQEFVPEKEAKKENSRNLASKKDTNEDITSLRARLALETDALAAELDNQRALRNGEITQRQFDDEAELQQIRFKFEERRLAIDENEKLTATQRAQLKLDLGEQELISEEIFQQRLTEVSNKGVSDRESYQIQSNSLVIQSQNQTQQAALGLLSGFAGKSKKAALAILAVQKGLAIANTISGALAGSVKVYGELPYPAAVVASGQILAQGKITAGLIAATGLAQASNITSSSGGGGGGFSSTPNPAPVAAVPQQQPESIRETEIRGIEDLKQEIRDAGILSSETTLRIIDSIADYKINNG